MKEVIINGIKVFSFTSRKQLIDYISEEKKCLVAINVEKILHSTHQTREMINGNIGYADGIGAVIALRRKGIKKPIKIPGCELWLDIVNHFYKSKTFYIIGAKEEIIQKTIEKLNKDFPGIDILGYRNGYIKSKEEEMDLLQTISNLKPDIVFVAMGSPKQELLIQKMQKYHAAIYQGLGGSFDLYVGNIKPVPDWWKKIFKWEGLYRTLLDYKNINRWKRQKVFFEFIHALITRKI